MGEIQRERPYIENGEMSYVRSRKPELESDDWSITKRPYRDISGSELLEDLGCQVTCFLAGNRVLMGDGSQKFIEDVVVGDMVQTMSGIDRVRMLERPLLGYTRRVIEIRGVGDECLFISDEHPMWASRPTEGGGTSEGWGTYNLSHYLYENRNSIEPKLTASPFALGFDMPEQLAHVSGWLHVRPIFHHLSPSTQLYNIVTESAFSCFVEGFAVFSHGLKQTELKAPWKGLKSDLAASQFVQDLLEPQA